MGDFASHVSIDAYEFQWDFLSLQKDLVLIRLITGLNVTEFYFPLTVTEKQL